MESKLNWQGPFNSDKKVPYDYYKAETLLGLITIEFKSWKASDLPSIMIDNDLFDNGYLGCESNIEDAKKFAENKIHEKYLELKKNI